MENVTTEILEFGMIACFGAAWPISIRKSIKSRTSRGKSFIFLMIILLGYLFGITRKVVTGSYQIAFYAYCINLVLVAADSAIWLYNYRHYDKADSDL